MLYIQHPRSKLPEIASSAFAQGMKDTQVRKAFKDELILRGFEMAPDDMNPEDAQKQGYQKTSYGFLRKKAPEGTVEYLGRGGLGTGAPAGIATKTRGQVTGFTPTPEDRVWLTGPEGNKFQVPRSEAREMLGQPSGKYVRGQITETEAQRKRKAELVKTKREHEMGLAQVKADQTFKKQIAKEERALKTQIAKEQRKAKRDAVEIAKSGNLNWTDKEQYKSAVKQVAILQETIYSSMTQPEDKAAAKAELAEIQTLMKTIEEKAAGVEPPEIEEPPVPGAQKAPDGNWYILQENGKYALVEPKAKGNDGLRADGTEKGRGFLGELKRPDGQVSTELSIGVNIDGQEMEIPTLIPTLSKNEVSYLLSGKEPTEQIVKKAVAHVRKRLAQGKSPFRAKGEPVQKPKSKPKPKKTRQERLEEAKRRRDKAFGAIQSRGASAIGEGMKRGHGALTGWTRGILDR